MDEENRRDGFQIAGKGEPRLLPVAPK